MMEENKQQQESPKTSRLYVKNLPANWNDYDVFRLFEGFGTVYEVKLPDIEPHFTSRYGFVEMRRPSEVARAIEILNGVQDLSSVEDVKADFKLSLPLYVTWCQDNYRKKRQNQQDSARIFRSTTTTPVQDDANGRMSPDDAGAKQLGSKSPVPSEQLLELPDDKENPNSSADSWASAEMELSSKQKPGTDKRHVRFSPEHHVPVTYSALKKSSLMPNVQTKVSVLHAEFPNSFYLILEGEMGEMYGFTDKLANNYKNTVPVQYIPQVGEICVAQHMANDEVHWSRVVVKAHSRQKRFEADKPKRIECFFLDEGKTRWIDLDGIRPIEKTFTDFPIQAIHCGLNGIKPYSPTGWSRDAADMLIQLADEAGSVHAELKGTCGEKSLVEIVLKNREGKKTFMTKELVSRGFALRTQSTEKQKQWETSRGERTEKKDSVKRCLRMEDLKDPVVPLNEEILLTVTALAESGEIGVVCVQEPTTDDYLTNGLMVVEKSHQENEKVPGFKPKPGDVVTYHLAAYSRGVVRNRPLVPGKVWVENLETGIEHLLPLRDVHPAGASVADWPPCRIKCKLSQGSTLPGEKQLITGMLSKKTNGEMRLTII